MAIKIFTASDINLLTSKLSENIRLSKNVFIPDYLITSNTGINNWIKIQLAEKNKIASNLRFVRNDELMDIAYHVLNENESELKLLSSSSLLWMIYAELGEQDFQDKFPETAKYIKEDVLKQHGLALKLTTLFEEYQIYISDDFNDVTKEEFQRYIWEKIKLKIKGGYLTRNDIKNKIFQLLNSSEKQLLLKEKIPNIHLFLGVDTTVYQIDILKKISEYTSVNYYVFNPFSATETQNNLVENWGKLLQCFPLNLESAISLSGDNPQEKDTTLLAKVQNDIQNNSTDKERINILKNDLKDESLIINNCYTTTREVEILYNYLIKIISESNGKLGARDILVQATNIDDYSSAINTVFSSAPIKLPFSISDRSYVTTDSVYNAIEALLNLNDKYKAEDIIQLLEFSSIQTKFEITDIDLIRSLVTMANIRFGTTGKTDNETDTVSWLHGLNRLIYGFCMGGNEHYELKNSEVENQGYLIDIVEGVAAGELINLHYFFNKIVEWVEQLNDPKIISDWHLSIDTLVNDFIESDKNDEISIFKKNLSELIEINEYLTEEVDFRVVKEFVTAILSTQQSRSNFASMGITFCSMSQMRNIPYKVVAVLGANLNAFPRKDRELSYNLMNEQKNLNNPSLKEQDKYLFLQLLMSAKQKLYISYIGKNTKTNSDIPPSSLVDDLCDYIYEGVADYNEEESNLITEHPLHGFNSKYNNSDHEEFYSYLLNKSKKSEKDDNGNNSNEDQRESTEIALKDFINFFKNPFKYFYNKILGIYYSEGQELLDDAELFELDNLQKWAIKNQLLDYDKDDLKTLRNELVEKGELPLKNMGEISLEVVSEEIQEMKKRLLETKGATKEEIILIEIPLGKKTLLGKIPNIYGDQFVFPCVSKESTNFKYIIDYQIKRIVLAASGESMVSSFISVDGKNDGIVNNKEITQIEAVGKLNKLYEFYKYGQDKIFPFTGEFNYALIKKMVTEDIAEVDKLLNAKVNPDYGDNFTTVPFVKEYNNGFFDNEKLEELKCNTEKIVVNILGIAL